MGYGVLGYVPRYGMLGMEYGGMGHGEWSIGVECGSGCWEQGSCYGLLGMVGYWVWDKACGVWSMASGVRGVV